MSEQLTSAQRISDNVAWLGRRAEEHPDCPECEAIFALAEAASVLLSSQFEEDHLDVLLTNICDALSDNEHEVQPLSSTSCSSPPPPSWAAVFCCSR
jgi:hypothetical protein